MKMFHKKNTQKNPNKKHTRTQDEMETFKKSWLASLLLLSFSVSVRKRATLWWVSLYPGVRKCQKWKNTRYQLNFTWNCSSLVLSENSEISRYLRLRCIHYKESSLRMFILVSWKQKLSFRFACCQRSWIGHCWIIKKRSSWKFCNLPSLGSVSLSNVSGYSVHRRYV